MTILVINSGRSSLKYALRLITLHLANGAGASAIRFRRCVDTSMGMNPLEGLVMGTRSGDIDPAVVTDLQCQAGLSATEVSDPLNRESGLRDGPDMRLIRRRAAGGIGPGLSGRDLCRGLSRSIGSINALLRSSPKCPLVVRRV